ncbi:hypothetical protein DYI37_02495 [Fulvimarina endophytica]|uniref:Uncharacterized protein n=1 Tax=Fulvimarina endophytica TaxID=2293836 RepID=A0A371XAV3_9HYPH|nr:hypothetical protein [Fulvimarina endophytica]RFC66339.1 hypothetical protein DYI37_02495 [Fulvimarina endophytica]
MMRTHRTVLTVSTLLFGLATGSVFAQSQDAPASSDDVMQSLSESADVLIGNEDPIASDKIDVSLGDWNVRTTIADKLSASISAIPLTVAVEPELASEVCPVREEDLEQQETVSAIRTCAAKSVNDDLVEATKAEMDKPDLDSIDLMPEAEAAPVPGSDGSAGSTSSEPAAAQPEPSTN